MTFFYNIAIACYRLLIGVASVKSVKAKQWIEGRKNWEQQLLSQLDRSRPSIWFHCASLGEFEQGRPLIEALRREEPSCQIVLTFFSPSGYEIRKDYDKVNAVAYLPMDSESNAKRFISIVNPEKVVFVKYEFWYHFLNQLHAQSIPVYVVSAIFREKQMFFRKWGGWYRKLLTKIDHFFVQDKNSQQLLSSVGIDKVTVSGDTRFDRVGDIAKAAKELPIVAQFCQKEMVITAGSTWGQDEDLLADFINRYKEVKFVVAPHEVGESKIQDLISKLHVKWQRYSELRSTKEVDSNAQVLIIDCVGILSSVYQYGHIAYIGGGFGVGIHNTLEPAAFGMPVVFGPNYERFREAVMMKETGSAFSIENGEQLNAIFEKLINTPDYLTQVSRISKDFVQNNRGATRQIVKELLTK